MSDVAVVILAAGKGTRMKSGQAKVLHRVAGKSMVLRVIESARSVSTENIHVVVGYQAEKVKTEVSKHFKVTFAHQKQLLGTGDAVKAAFPDLKADIRHVLVLCGDIPLVRADTLEQIVHTHRNTQSKVTVLAVKMDDPSGYGRLITGADGSLVAIREEADACESEKKIQIVNSGIYCFEKEFLQTALETVKPENKQAEYYLTDAVDIASRDKQKIGMLLADSPHQFMGVNTPEELEAAERLIQQTLG